MLGVDNLDAERQGLYETFQDLIDEATENLMRAGEMVNMGNERDDDKNDSDDKDEKTKKACKVNLF